ncbi:MULTISPECIES: hypothetical protein [Deinococcus]|uniref:hypothetical protein n=1 Tax=Deinococcus TaxID=1298 RepID=UPI00166CC66D|nr:MULTISPECIES: hypothetical protein [Deinococcus]MDK2011570.1 hypothetical protein [Deinococcus sp. 43]GGB57478.1 hypothetical protein GCM10008019_11750 [Deinococcus soli (ex Cha et al. 2016)]
MKTRLPLIAFAALPLTVGAVLAQQSAAPSTSATTAQAPQRVQPAQPGQRTGQNQAQQVQPQPGERPQRSGTNYADTFITNLARQLGTTPEKLKAAAVKAGSATIDAAVKAGDIPADRAADMKQRLTENPFAFGGRGPGGPGRGGHGPHDGPMGPGGPRGQDNQGPQGDGTDQGSAAQEGTTSGT